MDGPDTYFTYHNLRHHTDDSDHSSPQATGASESRLRGAPPLLHYSVNAPHHMARLIDDSSRPYGNQGVSHPALGPLHAHPTHHKVTIFSPGSNCPARSAESACCDFIFSLKRRRSSRMKWSSAFCCPSDSVQAGAGGRRGARRAVSTTESVRERESRVCGESCVRMYTYIHQVRAQGGGDASR